MKLKRLIPFLLMFVICNSCASAAKNSFASAGTTSNTSPLNSAIADARRYADNLIFTPPPPFTIYDRGTSEWVDYSKYGQFAGIGTSTYSYTIKNSTGLAAASGEGIYPNTQSVRNSPGFQRMLKDKTASPDSANQALFYKWALDTKSDPGVRLYYAALALEKSGNFQHAVKAYYACVVLFPKAKDYTQWNTPWYIGPVCIAKIRHLTTMHPEIGVRLTGAKILVMNGWDNDTSNDVFIVNPGKLIPAAAEDLAPKKIDLDEEGIAKITGNARVKIIKYKNGHYILTVDDKPYVIKGMSYSPARVGLSPDFGTLDNLKDWSWDDHNNNKRIDGPYDTWVDANRNERQDKNEPVVGDFALMKAMGVNTIRIYHSHGVNKDLLMDGYKRFGFMYLIGNLLGMYAKDSGAEWYAGTDYEDPAQLKNMLDSVRRMVEEYKNEPYVLMWVLGNENNYGVSGAETGELGSGNNAQRQPAAYYKFVNEAVKLIKQLDPQKRPVALCNGDVFLIQYAAKYAPDIDVYGANAYRGDYGFGNLFNDVRVVYDKPVLITEYGCPAYAKGWSVARAEAGQSDYHKGNWLDIVRNMGGIYDGAGNALGGIIFEWADEWWKAGYMYRADEHDTESQWMGPFLDGGAYEEWFGISSLGDGRDSPFKRQLRKVFFMYQNIWNK